MMTTSPFADATASAPAPRPDGRRMRTEDSRRRVVAALLDCVRAGEFDPSAEAVAHRAGVGLRTVFRLFKDKEGLIRQVSGVALSGFAELAATPLEGETWRARLDDMMSRRFMVFEQMMPFRRAGLAHAHTSEFVRGNNATIQQALRRALRAVLPPQLAEDADAFDALDMALSADAWIRLRIEQGLDPAHAQRVVRRIVEALAAGVA
jgi:AcrR family transcriptional regulator